MTPWEVSVPFTLTVDYELPQTPVFSPVLVSIFCWPKSVLLPLYSYHITSCLWMAAHSPALRSTFQAIGRRGKKGMTFPFKETSQKSPSSTYISLAIAWSQDYQLAVGTGGKEKLCLSKNWDSSRVATCNTCDHTASYSTFFLCKLILISVFMHTGPMYSFLILLTYKCTAWAGYLASICFSFLIQVRLVVCRPTLGPQLEHRDGEHSLLLFCQAWAAGTGPWHLCCHFVLCSSPPPGAVSTAVKNG